MREDIAYIILHMSPLELCDLQERGVKLSPFLAAKADAYRASRIRIPTARLTEASPAHEAVAA